MTSVTCPKCNLTSFGTAINCRRCGYFLQTLSEKASQVTQVPPEHKSSGEKDSNAPNENPPNFQAPNYPAGQVGCEIYATPTSSGYRSFYVASDGVIRGADKGGQPDGKSDPPIN